MPKVARTKRSKVNIYLEEFPNETFRSDGQVLYCQSCDKSVSIDRRGQVIQHINTSKHRGNKDRTLIFQQNFISTSSASTNGKSVFNDDLFHALMRSDIPLFKLKNVAFKKLVKISYDLKFMWSNLVNIIFNELKTFLVESFQKKKRDVSNVFKVPYLDQ